MIKDTLKFSLKLMLIFVAITVFTMIGLTLILSADISMPLRMLAGGVFILFYIGMLWDNCSRWGEKDCKAVITYVRNRGSAEQLKEARGQVYFPLKGFVAGAVAMLIPFILTVVYCIVSYKAYETGMAETSDLIYNILYLLFLAYTPMLVTATPVTTTAFFFYGMPQRGDFAIYGIGNMVMPYMFFIPIVLFILVCGVCYIMGYTKRRGEVPAHMREVYFPRNCKYVPMDHTGEDEEAPDTGAPSASAEGAEESPEERPEKGLAEGTADGVKAPADDAAGEDGAADGTQEPETAEHRQ